MLILFFVFCVFPFSFLFLHFFLCLLACQIVFVIWMALTVYNIDSDLTITPLTSSSMPSASLSEMAVTNSSMKGNNVLNVPAHSDLMITSSSSNSVASSGAIKSKKSAGLSMTPTNRSKVADFAKLSAMLHNNNAMQQQQMKMMANPEMTAAMAVAAGGPPFDPAFFQHVFAAAAVNAANAARLQNKQHVKQQQQSKSLANLMGATNNGNKSSSMFSGNKTKDQQSKTTAVTSTSITGNVALKQKSISIFLTGACSPGACDYNLACFFFLLSFFEYFLNHSKQ